MIAKWQGERDDERCQRALRDPSIVAEATDRALKGEDLHAEEPRFDGRFARDRETPQVVLPGR